MKFGNPLTEIEIDTLQPMHRSHPSRRARMRAHGMLLRHQHDRLKDMARFYQVARRRVAAWIDRWHTCGLGGVYDQARSGRPPIYSDHEQKHVAHSLQLYPQDVKQIIEEMATETRKRVRPKTMKRYIKKRPRLETDQEDD